MEWGNCPGGNCLGVIVRGGNLHRGLLPRGDCLGGNWHGEIIAKGGLSQGLLVGGNCPGGNFPVPIKYAACLKSSLTFDKSIKE